MATADGDGDAAVGKKRAFAQRWENKGCQENYLGLFRSEQREDRKEIYFFGLKVFFRCDRKLWKIYFCTNNLVFFLLFL